MPRSIPNILILAGLHLLSCTSRIKEMSANDVVFTSIFGDSKTDSTQTYCLLGRGYFRAPMSKNTDSLIKNWITTHPKAILIPVATHGPTLTDHPNSKMTYCWLIDKNDTLNNDLIRNGCFPGGTMMRPDTWDEMSDRQKSIYDEKPIMTVEIGEKEYNRFIEQIKVAEAEARKSRRGIWNKPANED